MFRIGTNIVSWRSNYKVASCSLSASGEMYVF